MEKREHVRPGRFVWVLSHPIEGTLHAPAIIEPTRELQNLGWDARLVAVGEGKHELDGVEIQGFTLPEVYLLGQLLFHLKVVVWLAQNWQNLDVIFFHQPSAPWLMPLRLYRALRPGKGPVLVMDTRDLNTLEKSLRNRLRILFFDVVHWVANWWFDGQTAITPQMVDLVGIPRRKVWGIWPSGVNWERYAPAREGRAWPQPAEPVRLVYIGKLHWERNLAPLCHAVQRAAAEGLPIILSVVGKGPEQAKLEEIAAQANGAIEMIPAVPIEQVVEVLRRAHVGVTSLPAADDEKFAASSPIKLFEYMAAGMPILATTNVCHTNVIQDAPFVFWIDEPTPDSIVPVLRRIEAARHDLPQLGQMATALGKNWTWSESGKKLSRALTFGLAFKKTT